MPNQTKAIIISLQQFQIKILNFGSLWCTYIWMYYVGIVAQTDVTIAFIFFNKVGENNAGH